MHTHNMSSDTAAEKRIGLGQRLLAFQKIFCVYLFYADQP